MPNQDNQSSQQDNSSGFDIKTFLPIALGVFFVLVLFVKVVFPSLEKGVDHSASGILEPTTEMNYESFFGE